MADDPTEPAFSADFMDLADRQTWLAFLAVSQGLVPRLDEHHKRRFGITHLEYMTLIMLAESGDGASELSALARRVNSSLSRMSHAIRRMERDGLVTLATSKKDRRATVATLSPAGADLLARAAVESWDEVKRLLIDVLDEAQREQLRQISLTILRAWHPHDPRPWLP